MKQLTIIVFASLSCIASVFSQCPNLPTPGGIGGTNEVCLGVDEGELILFNYVADSIYWQSAIDASGPWTDLNDTDSSYVFSSLNDTTYYRVMVLDTPCGDIDSTLAWEVIVHELPSMVFNADTVCFNQSTSFSYTLFSAEPIVFESWEFDNGFNSIGDSVSHVYSMPGVNTALLELVNNQGCRDTIRQDVYVNYLPEPNFTFDTVCAGLSTLFEHSSQNMPAMSNPIIDGTVDMITWDFTNGNVVSNLASITTTPNVFNMGQTYVVELLAISTLGCKDSITRGVLVHNVPEISLNIDTSCAGSIALITNNTNQNEAINFYWNMGNNDSVLTWNPFYAYADSGSYTLGLNITTTNGCVNNGFDTTIYVKPSPVADFSYVGSCIYDSITMVNNSAFPTGQDSIVWSYKGVSSNQEAPRVKYDSSGYYQVDLVVTDNNSCSSSTTKIVYVQPTPVAEFSYQSSCMSQDIQLMNLSNLVSTDSSSWYFGDGSFSADLHPLHAYEIIDTFSIVLIITSELGCVDTSIKEVIVYPIATPNFTNNVSCEGLPTSFSNTSTINNGGLIVGFDWDFGDGYSNNNENPIHQYLEPSSYLVTFEVTTDAGCITDTTIELDVTQFPIPDFDHVDQCIGEVVQFGNATTIPSGNVSYLWLFGDGDSSTVQYPTHYYSQSGTYIAKLIAQSEANCIDSISKIINIFDAPIVNAGADTTINEGSEIELNSVVNNAVVYAWAPLEEVSSSNSPNPLVSPLVSTEFILDVVDINGCTNSDTVMVNVTEVYDLMIYNIVTPNFNGENDTWIIENIEIFSDSHVEVYDRWGRKVYEMNAYDNSWNGTNGKDELPDGTYYYTLSFTSNDKIYSGAITLLRDK